MTIAFCACSLSALRGRTGIVVSCDFSVVFVSREWFVDYRDLGFEQGQRFKEERPFGAGAVELLLLLGFVGVRRLWKCLNEVKAV